MNVNVKPAGPVPGSYYQKELDGDARAVPPFLRESSPDKLGPDEIPIHKYVSREYHELEIERLWKRTWQWACREEEIPEVGSTFVYEICNMSVVIVRVAPDRIKAFQNVCLHRGRKLCDYSAKVSELRCPFHGFAWKLDGSFRSMPTSWDFPHVDRATFNLPEVRTATWAGFVFINMDANAAPLEETLGVVPEHFSRWELGERAIVANVSKVMRCNWKISQEGFLETYHVIATHPQLLSSFGAITSQYDILGPVNRTMAPNMSETPALGRTPSEQEKYDALTYQYLAGKPGIPLPENMRARSYAAQRGREYLKGVVGEKAENYCDSELVDTIAYSLFPNMTLFGGVGVRQLYRWRPWQNRSDMSTMDIVMIAPFKGERPKPAPLHFLGPDDSWRLAPELGGVALVEEQDAYNLEAVQRGLEGATHKSVVMSKYQESRIRHFHRMLDEIMERP